MRRSAKPPANDDDFEVYCLPVFRHWWKASDIKRYGRSGQSQHGIDLHGHVDATGDLIAIQLKLRNKGKLTRAVIEEDIKLLREWPSVGNLRRFVIATTSSRDTRLEDFALETDRASRESGGFAFSIVFWDDIVEYIQTHEDLAHLLGDGLGAMAAARIESKLDLLQSQIQPLAADPDTDINEAAEHLKKEEPDAAAALVSTVRRTRSASLTKRQQVKLCEILGIARIMQGRYEDGSAAFVEAAEISPDDPDAQALGALGRLNRGHTEEARKIAVEICKEHPQVARAHMVRIRCSPTPTDCDALEASVPAEVMHNGEVRLALAMVAMSTRQYARAESHARASLGAIPNWTAAKSVLASALIAAIKDEVLRSVIGVPEVFDRTRLNEAMEILNELLRDGSRRIPADEASVDYRNRALARRLLGDVAGAASDIHRAFELAPDDHDIAVVHAVELSDAGRYDEALGVLGRLQLTTAPLGATLLRCEVILERNGPGDAREAAELAAEAIKVGAATDSERLAAVDVQVRAAYVSEGAQRAIDVARSAALSSCARRVLEAEIRIRSGEGDKAISEGARLYEEAESESEPAVLARCARMMMHCGRWDDALLLWKRVIPESVVGPGTIDMLRSAERSRAPSARKFALDFCERLRQKGLFDGRAIRMEVALLDELQEWRRAIEVLQAARTVLTSDRTLDLLLCIVASHSGDTSLIDATEQILPSVESVEALDGCNAVMIMAHHGDIRAAVTYAYRLYRRYRDDPHAQRALVSVFFDPKINRVALQFEPPSVVMLGHVVVYERVQCGGTRVAVLETEPAADGAHDEYGPDHGLTRALLGAEVGSIVELPQSFAPLQVRVREIVPKELFRARECMASWSERFPTQPFIQEFRVPAADPSRPVGPRELLGPIVALLEKDARRLDTAVGLYQEGGLPIAAVAAVLGKGIVETVAHLSTHPAGIACAPNWSLAFEEAAKRIGDANVVILDGTAIGTLVRLGLQDLVALVPFRCMVTEVVVVELRQRVAALEAAHERREGLVTLGMVDGEPAVDVQSKEAVAYQLQRLRSVLKVVAALERVGGLPMLELESETAKELGYLHNSSSHAIAYAINRKLPVWSDDANIMSLPSSGRRIMRIWTQVIVDWLAMRRIISRERSDDIALAMLHYGYRHCAIRPSTIISGLGKVGWDCSNREALPLLARFGAGQLDAVTALMLALGTIRELWSMSVLPSNVPAVTRSILDRLASRDDGRQIVNALLQHLESCFGVNVIRGMQATRAIREWDATRGKA